MAVSGNCENGPPVAHGLGDSATLGAGRPTPPTGDRGACRPPLRRQGPPLYIRPPPPFPPHLSPKIPPKIQKKKRGEEKGSGETLPDSALVICRLVHLVYIFSI